MVSPDDQNCLRVKVGYEANFEFEEDCLQLLVGVLEVDAFAVHAIKTLLGTPRQANEEFVA